MELLQAPLTFALTFVSVVTQKTLKGVWWENWATEENATNQNQARKIKNIFQKDKN